MCYYYPGSHLFVASKRLVPQGSASGRFAACRVPVMAPLEVLEHGGPSLEAGWRRFQLLVAVIMACPANEA